MNDETTESITTKENVKLKRENEEIKRELKELKSELKELKEKMAYNDRLEHERGHGLF